MKQPSQRREAEGNVYLLHRSQEEQEAEAGRQRIRRFCRDLWHQHGAIAARACELPPELRVPMIAWANEIYGERICQKRGEHSQPETGRQEGAGAVSSEQTTGRQEGAGALRPELRQSKQKPAKTKPKT